MTEERKRGRGRKAGEGGVPSPDDALVFPAEAEPEVDRAPGSRLSLPASGLAEDILALAEKGALGAAGAGGAAAEPPDAGLVPGWGHNISFFAPARDERKAVEATEHLVTFFLADEEYGVDVRAVQEIIRVGEITPVPRTPDHIKGVINLRGRIIPVVDLRTKLGVGAVTVARQTRIVVVKVRERLIGLLVDGASQVLKVPVSTIEAAPEEVLDVDAQTIRGVAKLADRLIILLDLGRVLAQELREGAAGA